MIPNPLSHPVGAKKFLSGSILKREDGPILFLDFLLIGRMEI
jgi:hypothetical protein